MHKLRLSNLKIDISRQIIVSIFTPDRKWLLKMLGSNYYLWDVTGVTGVGRLYSKFDR